MLDIAGYVYKSVADWYQSDYCGVFPHSNPTGRASGTDSVVRGGGWDDNYGYVRVTCRRHSPPGFNDYLIAVRYALGAR